MIPQQMIRKMTLEVRYKLQLVVVTTPFRQLPKIFNLNTMLLVRKNASVTRNAIGGLISDLLMAPIAQQTKTMYQKLKNLILID